MIREFTLNAIFSVCGKLIVLLYKTTENSIVVINDRSLLVTELIEFTSTKKNNFLITFLFYFLKSRFFGWCPNWYVYWTTLQMRMVTVNLSTASFIFPNESEIHLTRRLDRIVCFCCCSFVVHCLLAAHIWKK